MRTPVIHAGFGHSGTSSLQENFFAQRSDLHYCGVPYSELGGIFSSIKYTDDTAFDLNGIKEHVERLIFSKCPEHARIIASDETFTEQPEIYYTPAMVPLGVIAHRLHAMLPNSLVLFTLRSQFRYVVSLYLNLKRNYANINKRPIESFDEWFDGQFTQERNLFLRNLDYSTAIRVYASVFGRDALRVLPLELITLSGPKAYLKKLGTLLDIPVDDGDTERFLNVKNRRATLLESEVLNLWPNPAFRRFWQNFRRAAGVRATNVALANSPAVELELSSEQREKIIAVCGRGNTWIQKEFGVPLDVFQYPGD